VLTAVTHIKARALSGDNAAGQPWSALNEATFSVVAEERRLRLTEIMYNPLDGSDYEFIELRNVGSADIDLAGFSFEGIDYTFPARARLAAAECLVLVRNQQAFSERYPGIAAAGVYDGKLSNKGETILLKNAAGEPLTSISYDDENGWPLTPDGRGDSLELVRVEADPNDPKSWQASSHLYGTPCS
jgi:hypothetical protein